MSGRVIAIGLDGYESSIADDMVRAGRLPNIASLRTTSAVFGLDHGAARRTGLAWEHFASGLAPEEANRHSAVDFNHSSYSVQQHGARFTPFTESLDCETVVFDAPYFDLSRTINAKGVVNWGAHDPGVNSLSKPDELLGELTERYGSYPAKEWIYGFVWPSPENTSRMGTDLSRAVDVRLEITRWLLCERLRNWRFGLVVVSELHSAIEALWHGVDPSHPLADAPSAEPARYAIESVYQAVDRLVGALSIEFPDDYLIVFSMHGMGANEADVPGMLLLPELLYRWQFNSVRFRANGNWSPGNPPARFLEENERWTPAIRRHFQNGLPIRWLMRRLTRPMHDGTSRHPGGAEYESALTRSPAWMPAMWYQRYWPEMDAFALPSFYDGRVRLNLRGRERYGRVPLKTYRGVCDTLSIILRDSVDTGTGEPVVAGIKIKPESEALGRSGTDCDLIVDWRPGVTGLRYPGLGDIGPAPLRRPGGHSGGDGQAWVKGPGIQAGCWGRASAFDVVPTIFGLMGQQVPQGVAGDNLFKG